MVFVGSFFLGRTRTHLQILQPPPKLLVADGWGESRDSPTVRVERWHPRFGPAGKTLRMVTTQTCTSCFRSGSPGWTSPHYLQVSRQGTVTGSARFSKQHPSPTAPRDRLEPPAQTWCHLRLPLRTRRRLRALGEEIMIPSTTPSKVGRRNGSALRSVYGDPFQEVHHDAGVRCVKIAQHLMDLLSSRLVFLPVSQFLRTYRPKGWRVFLED